MLDRDGKFKPSLPVKIPLRHILRLKTSIESFDGGRKKYNHLLGPHGKSVQETQFNIVKLYRKADFRVSARFKSSLARSCDITLLGLWDSVSTYGWIYDPLHLPWTSNNPEVGAIRHAMAIDERRMFFKVHRKYKPPFFGNQASICGYKKHHDASRPQAGKITQRGRQEPLCPFGQNEHDQDDCGRDR